MPPPFSAPGFFWDESKKRFFPLSGRRPQPSFADAQSPPTQPTTASSSRGGKSIIRKDDQDPLLLASSKSHCRRRALRATMDAAIMRTSSCDSSDIPIRGSSITAFCSIRASEGEVVCFVGDDFASIYATVARSPSADSSMPSQTFGRSRNSLAEAWSPFWILNDCRVDCPTAISSMSVSGSCWAATTFGPMQKILIVSDLSSDQYEISSILPTLKIPEIWTSNLYRRRLVVGAGRGALLVDDVARPSARTVKYSSDIFSLHQTENLFYAGARNGSISAYDLRTKQTRQVIDGRDSLDAGGRIEGKYRHQARVGRRCHRSSVIHLEVVRDWQLLTSEMNGRLSTYDLRFLRQDRDEPLVEFAGHVNSLTTRLGIAVDPQANYLIAAGEDQRIRIWSLDSGQPLQSPLLDALETTACPSYDSPFTSVYPKPVSALQVNEDALTGELSLWATADKTLYRYYLGQTSID